MQILTVAACDTCGVLLSRYLGRLVIPGMEKWPPDKIHSYGGLLDCPVCKEVGHYREIQILTDDDR